MTHLSLASSGPPETTRTVLELLLQAWARQDFDEAAAWFAESGTYVLHLPKDVAPMAGTHCGPADIRRAFLAQPPEWRHVSFSASLRAIDDDTARATVAFAYKHLPSGEVLRGCMRLVATVAHRRVQRLEEFHDEAMVGAFLRYVAWATRQEAEEPE